MDGQRTAHTFKLTLHEFYMGTDRDRYNDQNVWIRAWGRDESVWGRRDGTGRFNGGRYPFSLLSIDNFKIDKLL